MDVYAALQMLLPADHQTPPPTLDTEQHTTIPCRTPQYHHTTYTLPFSPPAEPHSLQHTLQPPGSHTAYHPTSHDPAFLEPAAEAGPSWSPAQPEGLWHEAGGAGEIVVDSHSDLEMVVGRKRPYQGSVGTPSGPTESGNVKAHRRLLDDG